METNITCPKCNHEFNVEDVLLQRVEAKCREELNGKIAEMEKTFLQKESALKRREQDLKTQSADMDRQIEEKAKAEAAAKEVAIKKKIAEEYAVKIQSLIEAESEAKQKLAEMRTTLLENEKLKRQIDEQADMLKIEYERKLTEQIKEKTETIRNSEKENFELLRMREQEDAALKIKELEMKLDAQNKHIDEMKRKAEQGSTQQQGEAQELVLEKLFRDMYEREGDEITEVKKGQRGADVLHVVQTKHGDVCGKIYYESKRTKSFEDKWLQKLRDDNIAVGADVLVIVTQTMPAGHDHFFHKDGVWICPLWEVKALSMVLRDSIQRVHETRIFQHGKETKKEEIYDYLTSKEFAAQFGAILEGFKSLQDNYSDEKRRMEAIWKEREKQLDKVLRNAARFYGSIRGIAGRSVPEMKLLEIPETKLLDRDALSVASSEE